MSLFFGHTPDSFALIPTLIVQLGRCQCHPDRVGAVNLMVSFLGMEMGLQFEFYRHG